MFTDNNLYISQFQDIVGKGIAQISTIKPSDWVEQNVVMGKPRPGPFRYDYTPYTREIVDRMAPDNPARKIAVKKGAQIGFSSGVIIPGLGWMIKNNPGNCYLMVGAPDLIPKAMEKLDLMIDSANIRSYIKPQVQRNRANKSGDTNLKKDFSGGYVSVGSANNHKAIAQVDLQYIFLDDLDQMKGSSKSSGDLIKLIEKRTAAYKDIYKMFLISTPLLESSSLIEPAFLLGDQRKYFIECPCCHEPIILEWEVAEGDVINKLTSDVALNKGGIHFETNNYGQVVESSVGYICYKCAGFFNDKDKYNMLNGGFWVPTAIPSRDDYFSYDIPSLYAPIGMFDWLQCARDFVECNPPGQPRKESQYQVFVNTVLGKTHKPETESPRANSIQKNIRNYDIGTIPDKLSLADGNGPIVLLTFAADMNGVMNDETGDDVRLDYEVLAWAANGATYSIQHGSIGTFVPAALRKKDHELIDRRKYTYKQYGENSVWPELDAIMQRVYETDTGRKMQIMMGGLDCGHHSIHAYAYLDRTNSRMCGLKGKGEDKYVRFGIDAKIHKPSVERQNLYILTVGLIKDSLSEYMGLRWTTNDPAQPANFMNFPQPSAGLYGFTGYFEHFESEHRVVETNSEGAGESYCWKKKASNLQNHFFDVRIYNLAIKDIFIWLLGRETKNPHFSWADYAARVQQGQ